MKLLISILLCACFTCKNNIKKEIINNNIKGSKENFQNLEKEHPIYSRVSDTEVYFKDIVGDTVYYYYEIEFNNKNISNNGEALYHYFYIKN